jgi:prephenate dehydrogenase (NADP+)
MGAAWKTRSTFPWENNRYLGGIDNVKILTTLRIFSNKWHVYAGLAIMNPSARLQVQQYAKSVSELFMLMIQEKKIEFEERIRRVIRIFNTRQTHLFLVIMKEENQSYFPIQY